NELRDACRERLSAFKIPDEFHEVAAIPRTASGKARRRVLAERLAPVPDDGAAAGLRQRLAELSSAQREAALRELVRAEIIAVGGWTGAGELQLGRPFVDLGVTSLVGVTLWDRLRARTGLRLPTTLAFDQPTPEDVVR